MVVKSEKIGGSPNPLIPNFLLEIPINPHCFFFNLQFAIKSLFLNLNQFFFYQAEVLAQPQFDKYQKQTLDQNGLDDVAPFKFEMCKKCAQKPLSEEGIGKTNSEEKNFKENYMFK